MFGRRFVWQSYGWDDGGSFPWQRPPTPDVPHFWQARRGRPPSGPGPHGPHGHGPRGPAAFFERLRFFGRGDLKYVLLELLQERPMHGYEMMKVLEERAGGFYTPSPGSIYPTLQMLEDRGFITSSEAEGRKVYTITEAGRAFLAEHQHEAERFGPGWPLHAAKARGWSPELQALRQEAGEVARLFMIAGRSSVGDPNRLSRLRSILERTHKDLTDLIYGSPSSAASNSPTGPSSESSHAEEGPSSSSATSDEPPAQS
ncbi:PadR family transcriptional regulator [Thermogemmatispora onikobensis]|uniref:PadR family transcriptional regulator n=1 Tax=Thermogemmatispora onikobensis TaxID=732234 RepID=UPI000852FF2F|nr:PadR family transcriptional regulator [Thermogemmatispora onikobensis]